MDSFNKKKSDQLNFLNNQSIHNLSSEMTAFKNNSLNESLESQLDTKVKSIESILIIDTETTGLDENKHEIVEVGCILFNLPSKAVLSQMSFLLPVNSNKAEYINGISPEVSRLPQPWENSIKLFLNLVDCCDFIVAHNVEFDRKWFGKGRLPNLNKKWICSLEDINWSFKRNLKTRPSVTDLALSFEIPVWNLHRALSDCYYLSEVFKKCSNLQELFLDAAEPRLLYKAMVSYEDRILAKEAGFRWNSPIQGAWTKRLSEKEAAELDFNVEVFKK